MSSGASSTLICTSAPSRRSTRRFGGRRCPRSRCRTTSRSASTTALWPSLVTRWTRCAKRATRTWTARSWPRTCRSPSTWRTMCVTPLQPPASPCHPHPRFCVYPYPLRCACLRPASLTPRSAGRQRSTIMTPSSPASTRAWQRFRTTRLTSRSPRCALSLITHR